MTDIPLMCPVEPHEMDKRMRRGFEDIVSRVIAAAAARDWGRDLHLRIYTAGIFHGVELQKRAASGIETEGQDGETRLGAKHESPTGGDAQ